MAENKGVALAILGIVSVLAIVGLVLLFTKAGASGQVSMPYAKVYTRTSANLEEYPYPYLEGRGAGGTPADAGYYPAGIAVSDDYAKEEDIPNFGTTIAQGRQSYGRQPRHIPSIQTCASGTGEAGEIPCPIYKGMQSICLSKYSEAEARELVGWEPVPGSPGCYVPEAA